MQISLVLAAALAGSLASNVHAACSAQSGAKTQPIIELYTSEGCDSCPPADKWLNALAPEQLGAVPLAFHVDYWNYLGWKDPFAKAQYSDRQRDSVRRQNGRVSYTPQVIVDGTDSRTWFSGKPFTESVSKLQGRAPLAQINLQAAWKDRAVALSTEVKVANPEARTHARVYVAVTENNLVSKVTAGENRGVTLKHNHVVRELLGPFPLDANGVLALERSQPTGTDWKAADLAAVVFVQDAQSGKTLQALRLPICSS